MPSPLELLMKMSMDKLNVSLATIKDFSQSKTTTTTTTTVSSSLLDESAETTTEKYPDLPEVIETSTPYSVILDALRNISTSSYANSTSQESILNQIDPANILLKIEEAFGYMIPMINVNEPVMIQTGECFDLI